MKNETHPDIDNVTVEQATALMWLIVCAGARECKCHVVDKCVTCNSMEQAAAAFPNIYNTYEKQKRETK
jgi:hypothetical protein